MDINKSRQTILLVDDEISILEVAREHFQDLGYDVLIAQDGHEAVDIIEKKDVSIDCCFTDINMPGMDGLELAEYLRSHDNTVPVVIMTGYPSLDNTLRTLKNGVVDFLIKPVDLNQMSFCLQRVLRERELFIKNILLNKELESKQRIEELNRELVVKVDELRILNKIMTELVSLRSGSEVFQHLVHMATSITPAENAVFYVVSDAFDKPFELSVIGSKTQNAISSGLNQLIEDIASDGKPLLISENKNFNKLPFPVHSFLGIPLNIRNKVFGVLAAYCVTKDRIFTEKDLYHLTFMIQQAGYLVENVALYENIYENLFATLSAFVKAVEARDIYTKQHSNRVTDMAVIIASEWGCSKEEIDVLDFAGRLHDIGKIGIRDDILLKPGPLTAAEYETIKAHPVIGESIIGQMGLWDREKKIIRHHHERYDGSGYPDGLKGGDIPILARILAVADAYDAMVSIRAYRKEMSSKEVLRIIKYGRGTQFDPDIVDLFLSLCERNQFAKIYQAAG